MKVFRIKVKPARLNPNPPPLKVPRAPRRKTNYYFRILNKIRKEMSVKVV